MIGVVYLSAKICVFQFVDATGLLWLLLWRRLTMTQYA